MKPIRNNTPRVIFTGFKDESIVPLVPELEENPIHLPLLYVFAQRGPEAPVLCGPVGDFRRIYGAESVNPRSPFYTHQTKLLETITAEANSVLVKRLFPDDAEVSGLTLLCKVTRREWVDDQTDGAFYRRARNVDGSFLTNQGRYMYAVSAASAGTAIDPVDGTITPQFDGSGVLTGFLVNGGTTPVVAPFTALWDKSYLIEDMVGFDRTAIGTTHLNNGHVVTFNDDGTAFDATYKPVQTKSALVAGTDGTQPVYVPKSLVLSWELVPNEYDGSGNLVDTLTKISYDDNSTDNTLDEDVQRLTIPVQTLYAASHGSWGDNIGMRMWVDRDYSATVVDDNKALTLKAMFLERAAPGKPAYVKETLKRSATVDFTYNPSAFNENTQEDLYVNNIVSYYNDDGIATGTSPTFGPIGEVVLHEVAYVDVDASTALSAEFASRFTTQGITKNIEVLYMMVAEAEADARAAESGIGEFDANTDAMLLNIFDGASLNGVPYYGFRVGSFHSAGGALVDDVDTVIDEVTGTDGTLYESYPSLEAPSMVPFDTVNIHYLGGGQDGTMTNATFEAAVQYEVLNNYNNPEYSLTDTGRYPFSAIYDSGFSMDTKVELFNWLAYRHDVHVTVGTHVAGEKLNIATDEARAAQLIAAAQQYAESEEWGTKCVRAVILAHSSKMLRGSYRERLPMTFELAQKRARKLGAGNGNVKYGYDYTQLPGSALELMNPGEVNNVFMEYEDREQLWTSGANFCMFADRSTVFFPALQTVYDPRNSVLTSEYIMQIGVDVVKQCDKTWKFMSGNTDLTPEQFLQRSNEKLTELTVDKYGPGVTVTPNAYYTEADSARGYSWVMEAIVTGNVMKTTATVNIIFRRAID